MSDRRRLNGPAGSTQPAQFLPSSVPVPLKRTRQPNELRKIFLQTGLIPSANGSAFYELEAPSPPKRSLIPATSTIKLSCAVHGPKPLSRNSSFSPNLQLTASVKFAPFASKVRRGYGRDSTERDLGVHLENALKGVIIQDRWPKSSIDVAITVLETEDAQFNTQDRQQTGVQNLGLMNVLAGCITVASAALVDAKVDCLDMMTGGVAALLSKRQDKAVYVLDPSPVDQEQVDAACVVGYLPSRDEVTEIWIAGHTPGRDKADGSGFDAVLDQATSAARAVQSVFKEVLIESANRGLGISSLQQKSHEQMNDVEMKQ